MRMYYYRWIIQKFKVPNDELSTRAFGNAVVGTKVQG